MKLLQVPVNFHLCSEPLPTLLYLAYMRMCLSEGFLLLLPLYRMILLLVLVHLSWVDTSPPDALLVFTQLALPAPLLGVDTAHMVWQASLPPCSIAAPTTPCTGVADT